MGRAIDVDLEAIVGLIPGLDDLRYLFFDRATRRIGDRRKKEVAVNPYADFPFHAGLFAARFDWFEPKRERRDGFAGLARKNRHRQNFSKGFAAFCSVGDVTELLLMRNSLQREPRFFLWKQCADLRNIARRNHPTLRIRKSIKLPAQRVGP